MLTIIDVSDEVGIQASIVAFNKEKWYGTNRDVREDIFSSKYSMTLINISVVIPPLLEQKVKQSIVL